MTTRESLPAAGTHQRNRLIAGCALALGLLAVAASIEGHLIQRAEATAALVVLTDKARGDLSRLRSVVQEVEAGERGFVLTGDPVFLEPLEGNLADVMALERKLEEEISSEEVKTSLRVLKAAIRSADCGFAPRCGPAPAGRLRGCPRGGGDR